MLERSLNGGTLSRDDVTHYGKIVVTLKETIRLMGEIDELIPSWPIEWVSPQVLRTALRVCVFTSRVL